MHKVPINQYSTVDSITVTKKPVSIASNPFAPRKLELTQDNLTSLKNDIFDAMYHTKLVLEYLSDRYKSINQVLESRGK